MQHTQTSQLLRVQGLLGNFYSFSTGKFLSQSRGRVLKSRQQGIVYQDNF